MPTFPARYESLAEICDTVTRAAQKAGLDEAAIYAVQTAVDEACTNIIEHAYANQPGELECQCSDDEQVFRVTLQDHGQPFDPSSVPAPDVQARLEERAIGGLGLYFMRQLMDEVNFEFQAAGGGTPGNNILTLVKRKPPSAEVKHVPDPSSASVYAALQRRSEQLVSVAEVSHAINSLLDLTELLQEVVNLIPKRLGYPYVVIFSVHPGRRKVFYEAGSIPNNARLREEGFAFDLDDPQGIVPWAARHGQTILANDVSREPLYRAVSESGLAQIRSELAVPLIFGKDEKNVLGVLDVQSDQAYAFSEDDRALFEALAASISVAMRNASLYHTELWRRKVADGLREVAGLLSADADLPQVLEAILAEIEQNLPCEAAAIWLLEQSDSETPGFNAEEEEGDESPQLELAAVRVAGSDLHLELSQQAPGDWLTEALEADKPTTRPAGAPYEPLGQQLQFPPEYSAIAAPLRIGRRLLGLLTLAHHTPNRYGSEARSVCASFASYAAVAIENTRLYEASHEQAWAATVLLQVAEATQSITDPVDLLTTVTEITPSLVGVSACALWLWNDVDEIFWPVASSGFPPEQELEFQLARFALGEQDCFDQVVAESRLVVAHSADLTILTSTLECTKVLYPLIAHQEVLGVMLVSFNLQADELSSEKLGIIQGITRQTAIAIENIRLFRSQREEAYVSVALLQVAQAVVSLNDLGEMLDTIVRITPMLVGVERTAIFLWEEGHAQYRLFRSYGLDRQAEESFKAQPFAGGMFPLLDLAREHDQLAYAAVNPPAEADVPGEMLWPQLEAALPAKQATGFERALLRENCCLLLAFPLSVKGKPLGVLLAQESASPGGASGSIRERRLEIVTGISQQVSLAIQNDRLQKEVLERERLERDLQLAREIQRTFLPDKLPTRPGLEIDARWRPAHQVGGDFYDVIEFADGRLGLVIADVADKGMPAALIMTLMRTLIRATAQEETSPARVLERVNNLLAPDVRNGMFVTAVYVVLSANGRELLYANAGHNLPLVRRSQAAEGEPLSAVEALPRCGMALGIEEGTRIREERLSLGVGDLLILYTDGVTESFSPEGEMYGEERLHLVVHAADTSSANAMLEAIDDSVNAFSASEYPSDDLTLMVLKVTAGNSFQ